MSLQLRRSGLKVAVVLIMLSALVLGGCASVAPVVRTSGNADRLINDPRFESVKTSNPDVQSWAYDAINTVNDLEYEVRVRNNGTNK
jgi:PBP1b-binding outer membrane lipoprotein LpoB